MKGKKMKKIVFDCDNTFGTKDCDVDDGLALMYLLGSRDAELLGVTSTYGNNNLDVVQAVNLRMLGELEAYLKGKGTVPLSAMPDSLRRYLELGEDAVFIALLEDGMTNPV